MTGIPSSAPQAPATVAITSLAIAAGLAGHSLVVCFRDYPAPLLCELWKRLTGAFDAEQVSHVRTAKDVRDLAPEVRVIIVHAPRLLNQVNWMLRFRRSQADGTAPVVLIASAPDNLDDDPGATLVLQGDPTECNEIDAWLLPVSEGSAERHSEVWPPVRNRNPHFDSVMRQQFTTTCSSVDRLRHYLVVQGLMAGASVRRTNFTDGRSVNSASIELEDYALVRRLLQSQIVSPGRELCNPLAIVMVDRANVYLAVKQDPQATTRNPFYTNSEDAPHFRRPPRELITRRELADLGNPRSRMVRRLVDHLHTQADSHGAIQRLGYHRHPPTREEWRTSGTEFVLPQLITWSAKQVRTHFDRLQNAKLVSAERQQENGPWRYVLPEELSTAVSPFHGLPSVAALQSVELAADVGDGTTR